MCLCAICPSLRKCSNILPIFNWIICLLVIELSESSFHPGMISSVGYGPCECCLSTVAYLSEGASVNASRALVTLVLGLALASHTLGTGPASSLDASKMALPCTFFLPFRPRAYQALCCFLTLCFLLTSQVSSQMSHPQGLLGDFLFQLFISPTDLTSFHN